MGFHVGDEVEWTSQAGGRTKKKVGVIVEVIHPGEIPEARAYSDLACKGIGFWRDKESYVVAVKDGKRAVKHYWPRVKGLTARKKDQQEEAS